MRKRNRVPDHVAAIHGRSNFVVTVVDGGWKVTIRPRRRPDEIVMCTSPGEMNRLRQKLTDEGFVGLVIEAA